MDRAEELLRAEAERIKQELADHDPVAFTQKVVAEVNRLEDAAVYLHGGDGLTSCGGSCCEGFRRGARMDEEDED